MNIPMLDVAIGMALVFFLFSIVVSGVEESISAILNSRGKGLSNWLIDLLGKQGDQKPGGTLTLTDKVLGHGLIASLRDNGWLSKVQRYGFPSYIPHDVLARVLVSVLGDNAGGDFVKLKEAIDKLANPELKSALLALADTGEKTVDAFEKRIQQWFAIQTDRLNGWYTRFVHWRLLVLGFLVAIALNVDALAIFNAFRQSDVLRAQAVELAKNIGDKCSPKEKDITTSTPTGETSASSSKLAKPPCPAQEKLDELSQNGLPIGWRQSEEPFDKNNSLYRWFGFLITALALSLGAKFWFDLLTKFMSVRSTGDPPSNKTKKV